MNVLELVRKLQSDLIQGRRIQIDDMSQLRVRLEDISKKLAHMKSTNDVKEIDFIIRRIGEVE